MIYQYQTLKNQVNPHFLFNNLNTLSSIVHSNLDLADIFIEKLASIYRYVLSHNDEKLIDLEDEIKFLDDYCFFHSLSNKGKIIIEKSLETENRYKIVPVTLQILVENAIKHNSSTTENPLKIRIFLCENTNTIMVINNLQKKLNIRHSLKIGLKNLNDRTELTMNRKIEVKTNKNEFQVEVPILKL